MWFKNIRAYRLTKPFDLSPEALGQKLAARTFVPCAKSQAVSFGWVAPLGEESEQLARRTGIECRLVVGEMEEVMPQEVETAAFRIFQDAAESFRI